MVLTMFGLVTNCTTDFAASLRPFFVCCGVCFKVNTQPFLYHHQQHQNECVLAWSSHTIWWVKAFPNSASFTDGFYFDQAQCRIMCLATLKDRSLCTLLSCLKIAHLQVGRHSLKITQVNIKVLISLIRVWIYLPSMRNLLGFILVTSVREHSNGSRSLINNMCFYCVATAGPHIYLKRTVRVVQWRHRVHACIQFVQKGSMPQGKSSVQCNAFYDSERIHLTSSFTGSAQN